MLKKLILSTILILSSCLIAIAEGLDGQGDIGLGSQNEEIYATAPDVLSQPIIHAIISCDNPPPDFQEQIKQSGARILKIGINTSIDGDEATSLAEAEKAIDFLPLTMVEVEVQGYETLNRIGQINFVMRIDGMIELLGIDGKLSETVNKIDEQ